MVWWMLVADVSPLHWEALWRVRTVAAAVNVNKNEFSLMNLVSSSCPVCFCCVGVFMWRVGGWTSPGKDSSAWIGSGYHEDGAKVRNRGPKTIPFFVRLEVYRKSCQHQAEERNIFNWPEKKNSLFFPLFLTVSFFLMQVVTSVYLPPEGGCVAGIGHSLLTTWQDAKKIYISMWYKIYLYCLLLN